MPGRNNSLQYRPFSEYKASRQTIEFAAKVHTNIARQNKIIAAVAQRDESLVNAHEIPTVDNRTRDDFLATLSMGQFDQQMLLTLEAVPNSLERSTPAEVLSQLRENPYDPVNDKENYSNQERINRQMQGIVAHFSRGSIGERGNLTGDDISKFLVDNPNPAVLDLSESASFLKTVENSNGFAKSEQYRESFQKLLPIIYGKRYDYYIQMKLLYAEAHERFPYQDATSTTLRG